MPLTVVFDTNFLTVPAQFGVDIFTEAERILERKVTFIVLDSIIEELKRNLANTQGAEAVKFRVALDLLERCNVVDYRGALVPVDDQVLEFCKSNNGILATNDRELRKRATAQGIPVLHLRSKKRLDLDGSLI